VITLGSIGDGMLPTSYQEHTAPVPFLWVMESPIKNKTKQTYNMNGIYNGGTQTATFKQKTFLGSAHLLGHQKLHHPLNPSTCKYYSKMPHKS
jgi:hypothetical protein